MSRADESMHLEAISGRNEKTQDSRMHFVGLEGPQRITVFIHATLGIQRLWYRSYEDQEPSM